MLHIPLISRHRTFLFLGMLRNVLQASYSMMQMQIDFLQQ
jgi:hypothetical protein